MSETLEKTLAITCEGTSYPVYREMNGEFQSIVLDLRHSVRSSVARLFGMVHLGHPEYYKAVEDLLDQRPTAKILKEGATLTGKEDVRQSFIMLAMLGILHKENIETATYGTLVSQPVLPERFFQRAIQADLSVEERLHVIQKEEEEIYMAGGILPLRMANLRVLGELFKKLGLRIPFVKEHLQSKIKFHTHELLQCMTQPIPIDQIPMQDDTALRNKNLLSIIHEMSKDSNVEIPWGGGHAPDIATGLTGSGEWKIDPESIQYLTYYSPKRLLTETELQQYLAEKEKEKALEEANGEGE